MAKKIDPSLSLDYILKKQEAEKLTGLSSSVASQIQAAGVSTEAAPEQASDTAVVSELKSINNNISKMAAAILQNSALLKTLVKGVKGPQAITPTTQQSAGTVTEGQLENENYQDKQISLLTKIEKNTKPGPKVQTKDLFGNLGGLATALALAIGGLIGVISAQVKLMRNFLRFLKDLLPENLMSKIRNGFKSVGNFFEDLFKAAKSKLAPIFEGVGKFFEEAFTKFKTIFGISEDSKIFKMFKGIKTIIGNFLAPFEEAFVIIKDLVSGPISKIGSFFGKIGDWFGMFAKSIGKVAIIAEKIAYPIMIVMAVWDTVKGFIEGFKKDGIVGGIKGAITGLFDSVVGGLLDMIKGAISWIAGALGFTNVEKWLDSFSFEDMFHSLIDTIFKPIEMIRDMFKKIGEWAYNLEIPGIGFSMFGKKFELGPWHPFKSDTAATPATATPVTNTTQAAPATATPQVAPTPSTASDVVYAKSSENSTMNYAPQAAPSNNIVNAPTTVVKQTSNNLVRTSLRNEDPSIRSYFRSRFAT